MPLSRMLLLSSLTLLGMSAGGPGSSSGKRLLACNMAALTPAQRTSHAALTKRLLKIARRTDLVDGYQFEIDSSEISVAEVAEWVANESRCCPAVDFHLDLPASGALALRLDGGADVKAFLAAELGL